MPHRLAITLLLNSFSSKLKRSVCEGILGCQMRVIKNEKKCVMAKRSGAKTIFSAFSSTGKCCV